MTKRHNVIKPNLRRRRLAEMQVNRFAATERIFDSATSRSIERYDSH